MRAVQRFYGPGLLAFITVLAVACGSDQPTTPARSALTGLFETTTNDSSTGSTSTGTGPGYFHGTVLAPSLPGSGNDSLASAPRIAGVAVTIYQQARGAQGEVELGANVGSVQTGADGKFQLPTLPAGQYVVTFVPPAGSAYNGVYAFGHLSELSANYAWWVVLPRK